MASSSPLFASNNIPLFFPLLREPFVARLQPCIADDPYLALHLCHRPIDTRCNVAPGWRAHRAADDSFGNHPRHPLPLNTILERLIEANVNWLTEGGASDWDVLHLYSQLLNFHHYRSHYVAAVAVEDEDGNDMLR
jgi:hypothetical protein